MAILKKDELVIFGRSPFIAQADVPALIKRYTTIGFNHFGRQYRPDYLFMFDAYYAGYIPTVVFTPHHFPQRHGMKYVPVPSNEPLLNQPHDPRGIRLAHKYFTVSIALNWALTQGFKKIYLVGIDHVETDRQFRHHDGNDLPSTLTPKAHKALKDYVYRCAEHADIYQCNPAVAPDWQLKYKDVKEFYV
jgi:hypothetical protein